MNLYDAHNHLQDAWLAPHYPQVFADLAAVGVRRAVVNGSSEADWPDVAALAAAHPVVLPSYGVHPWDAGNRSPAWQKNLLARLDADPRAAVGEIGLDRWMTDRAKPDDPRLAGLRIAPSYYGTRYVIADPWRYRLPQPGWGRTWVRHYNDVILVDTRRGVVIDVIRGFYR